MFDTVIDKSLQPEWSTETKTEFHLYSKENYIIPIDSYEEPKKKAEETKSSSNSSGKLRNKKIHSSTSASVTNKSKAKAVNESSKKVSIAPAAAAKPTNTRK